MKKCYSTSAFMMLSAFLVACSPEGSAGTAAKGSVGGTIVVSSAADADALVPPLTMSLLGKQVVDQMFDNLADIGPALNTVGDAGFTPRLSDRWSWASDSMSVSFHINPRARWHDGTPVRAEDVRYTFELVKTRRWPQRCRRIDNVDSVTVVDA